KIVQKNLRGQHREEWEKERCSRHAEHVSEVRAGVHQQILQDVSGSPSALDDSAVKNAKSGAQENDVGCVAGDIYRSPNRNADISRMQRWCVIDAVTNVANHVTALPQRTQNAQLLYRCDASKHRRLLRNVA